MSDRPTLAQLLDEAERLANQLTTFGVDASLRTHAMAVSDAEWLTKFRDTVRALVREARGVTVRASVPVEPRPEGSLAALLDAIFTDDSLRVTSFARRVTGVVSDPGWRKALADELTARGVVVSRPSLAGQPEDTTNGL